MNFFKKCICVVMTLAMASSVALTSYAAAPAQNTTSTSASTTVKKTTAPTKVALNNLKLELAQIGEVLLPKVEKVVDKGIDSIPKIRKTLKPVILSM